MQGQTGLVHQIENIGKLGGAKKDTDYGKGTDQEYLQGFSDDITVEQSHCKHPTKKMTWAVDSCARPGI